MYDQQAAHNPSPRSAQRQQLLWQAHQPVLVGCLQHLEVDVRALAGTTLVWVSGVECVLAVVLDCIGHAVQEGPERLLVQHRDLGDLVARAVRQAGRQQSRSQTQYASTTPPAA